MYYFLAVQGSRAVDSVPGSSLLCSSVLSFGYRVEAPWPQGKICNRAPTCHVPLYIKCVFLCDRGVSRPPRESGLRDNCYSCTPKAIALSEQFPSTLSVVSATTVLSFRFSKNKSIHVSCVLNGIYLMCATPIATTVKSTFGLAFTLIMCKKSIRCYHHTIPYKGCLAFNFASSRGIDLSSLRLIKG